jgi:hypothetical protein
VTNVKTNDNDAIAEFHAAVLAPMTARGVAFVLVHHERKGGRAKRGDRGEETLGGTQWSGKADNHVTLASLGKYEERPLPDGTVATSGRLELRRPKVRTGWVDAPIMLEVRGRKSGPGGADLELRIELADEADDALEALIAAAADEVGRGDLAKALELEPAGTRFRGLLGRALDSGRLEQVKRGRYRAATRPAEGA